MTSRRPFDVLAGICILSGLLLFLQTFRLASGIYKIWPVFPLVLGAGLVLIFYRRGRMETGALAIGIYLACFSALAFYYNFTSWTRIAETWPLFIGFLGLSFLGVSVHHNRERVFLLTGLFLLFLCLVFILVFSVDVRFWPISVVLFGISLLLARRYA